MALDAHDSTQPEPQGISVAEAAQMMGLGRTTLYNLVWTGKIKHFHAGKAVRILRDSVIEYMTSHQHKSHKRTYQKGGG